MKTFTLLIVSMILFTSCNKSNRDIKADKIGDYQMEKLPVNLTFKIIEDKSDDVLEKNQIVVELSKKISVGQIATLADQFYKSKTEQRRFYIFYLLPGMKNGETLAWATSHFDPKLKIEILGSTAEEENSLKILSTIKGDIIGKWHEESFTSSNFVIYIDHNKTYLMMFVGDSKSEKEEMVRKEIGKETRYDYKNKSHFGEYFIINSNKELEFYNAEGKKFTTATIIK